MKIFCLNHFIHGHTVRMLNELYNQPDEKFKDYCIVFEVDAIPYFNEIQESGLKIIYFDMEHIKAGGHKFNDGSIMKLVDIYSQIKNVVDEFWTYTLENFDILKNLGLNVKFRPFVYTNSLHTLPDIQDNFVPPIDVLFYGCLTNYRTDNMAKIIESLGVSFICAHGVTGAKQDWLIQNSKIIIDCKSLDTNYNQNVVRIFYPVINNRCVLSQHSNDDNYMGDSIFYYTNKADLAQKVIELLSNDKWREIGKNAGKKFYELSNSNDVWHTSNIEVK